MSEKTEKLEQLFTHVENKKLISGAVLAAEQGSPIFIKTLGKADVDTNEDIHEETIKIALIKRRALHGKTIFRDTERSHGFHQETASVFYQYGTFIS
ncbi:hypothetical protein ACJROX_09360 [Pseudalkalibacillus sp. A8]|uniref:hypothetical protein n=1 Tax=Pseudalkalibacillus sp. A8 TaxID=3382641 RepID=UPI0038B63F7B